MPTISWRSSMPSRSFSRSCGCRSASLLHIFQRSAQIGVGFYKTLGSQGEQARCRRCNQEFASRMHVEDLITVEKQLGYNYEMEDPKIEHYQWICPRCRRASLALAQTSLWSQQ